MSPGVFASIFPFTNEARSEFVRTVGDLDILEVLEENPRVLYLAEDSVSSAIKSLKVGAPVRSVVEAVSVYSISRMLLAGVGVPWAWARWTEAWKERNRNVIAKTSLVFSREARADAVGRYVQLVNHLTGWGVLSGEMTVRGVTYDFGVPMWDFLQASPSMGGRAWALSSQVVDAGVVWIEGPNRLARLAAEWIKSVMSPPKGAKPSDVPEVLDPVVADLRALVASELERLDRTSGSSRLVGSIDLSRASDRGDDFYPPCVRAALERARAPVNLRHDERLMVALFFLGIGWSEDRVVSLYNLQPDFGDGSVTRYQVSHAASKGYSVHGCKKIKALSLCRSGGDPYCERLSSPLWYVARRLETGGGK